VISQLESVARADNNMDEIDGPPRAYFLIPFGDNNFLRIVYVTIIWPITQEHVEDNMQKAVAGELVTAIKDELFAIGGGIIWWRSRPDLDVYNGPNGQVFKVRCRVATTPPLSEEAWKRLHRHTDGEQFA